MRRVDRRTNALQTDQPTDRPTDTASYRGALSHLKTKEKKKEHKNQTRRGKKSKNSRKKKAHNGRGANYEQRIPQVVKYERREKGMRLLCSRGIEGAKP